MLNWFVSSIEDEGEYEGELPVEEDMLHATMLKGYTPLRSSFSPSLYKNFRYIPYWVSFTVPSRYSTSMRLSIPLRLPISLSADVWLKWHDIVLDWNVVSSCVTSANTIGIPGKAWTRWGWVFLRYVSFYQCNRHVL
jgi:hypothetical protein